MFSRPWQVKPQQKLQRRLAYVMLLAALALIAADGIGVWIGRQEAMNNATLEAANIAGALAGEMSGVIQMTDTVLGGMRDQVETYGTAPASLSRLGRMLGAVNKALPMLRWIKVFDAQGRLLVRPASSQPGGQAGSQVGGDIAQAAYFAHHRDVTDRGFFIDGPMRDPADGSLVLTISCRIDKADGSFGGVVVASLSQEYLQNMLSGFDVGTTGVIVMLRSDSTLIARMPEDPKDIGRAVLRHPQPLGRVSGESVSPIDGILRLDSTAWVKDTPIVLRVGRGKAEVLGPWRAMAAFQGIGLTLVLAGLASLSLRLAQSIGEKERSNALLKWSNAQLAKSEALTARANRWLEMAEEMAQVGHWHISLNGGQKVTWSDEVYRLHGVTRATFTPTLEKVVQACHPEDRAMVRDTMRAAIDLGRPFERVSRIVRPDGTERHVLSRGFFQAAAGGAPPSIFGVMMDVTEQKRSEAALVEANANAEAANVALEAANQSLQAMALQDSLTGLANRRRFDRALDQEFRRAMRTGTPIGLILIDVDQFKEFNDMYGHQAGDACLRTIGAAIPPLLNRPGDIAARYGGEEIALLLPGTSLAGACALAERVAKAVRDLRLPHAGSVHGCVTISGGVEAFVPLRDSDGAAKLVEHADLALYAAKRAGRDRVVTYGDFMKTAESRAVPAFSAE